MSAGADDPRAGDIADGHAGSPGPPSHGERRLFAAIACVFVALAVAYSLILILGFGPDEPRHFQYLPLMVEQHRLPRVLPEGGELGGAIALHPPLYYSLLVPLYVSLRETAGLWWTQRILRLVSPIFGVLVLWLVWRSARRVFPRSPYAAALVPGLMAVWPHFVMDHSVINNDNGANLAGAGLIYFLVHRPGGAWTAKSALIGGLLLGAGALMKGQLLLCLPPVLLAIMAWDHGRDFWRQPRFWRNTAIALAALAVVAGWWYARNFALYGALNYVAPGYRGLPEGVSLIDGLSVGLVQSLVAVTFMGLFHSIWVQVGWFPEAMAGPLYAALAVLLAAAFAGWVVLAARARRGERLWGARRWRDLTAMILPFILIYLLIHLVVIFVHMGPHQGGRYAMFALPGFVVFLVAGWRFIVPRRFRTLGAVAVLALFLVLNAASMFNLLTYLNPTHAAGFSFWTTMPGT